MVVIVSVVASSISISFLLVSSVRASLADRSFLRGTVSTSVIRHRVCQRIGSVRDFGGFLLQTDRDVFL